MKQTKIKVGIIQHSSVHQNLKASVEKLTVLLEQAAQQGIQMVVVGEGWLSGYPVWFDYVPEAALWNHAPTKKLYARFRENSVVIDGAEMQHICALAKKYQMVLSLGMNERVERGLGAGSVYNSLVLIDANGELVNHHRKLVPTFTEKLVHAHGDAAGLKAEDTQVGKVGGLICWEHWMPLNRQALHNDAEQIHVAMWPNVHEMHQVASRQYAFEGRCFVLAAGQMLKAKDLPHELTLPENLAANPEQYILRGGSCIIAPDGRYIVPPVFDKEEIISAEIDLQEMYYEKMTLDTSGHYYRPDIFSFSVDRTRHELE